MAAVDLDDTAGATKHSTFHFRRHRFTDLMGQNESGLVLDVQVSGQCQRALAFDVVEEHHDRGKIGADRQLAEGEQRVGGQRELGDPRSMPRANWSRARCARG
jgi:hypothetical protein